MGKKCNIGLGLPIDWFTQYNMIQSGIR